MEEASGALLLGEAPHQAPPPGSEELRAAEAFSSRPWRRGEKAKLSAGLSISLEAHQSCYTDELPKRWQESPPLSFAARAAHQDAFLALLYNLLCGGPFQASHRSHRGFAGKWLVPASDGAAGD
jgi:hypothetical protein